MSLRRGRPLPVLPPGAVVLAAAALPLGPAPAAAASCAGPITPSSLTAAEAVVVGVVERSREDRALLAVEEVWSGPERAPLTWVVTGETRPGVSSSADIRLEQGARYLVGLSGPAPRTGTCSVLRLDDGLVSEQALALARPEEVRAPVPGADAGDAPGPSSSTVAAGGAVTAVLGGALVLWRRVRVRSVRDGGTPAGGVDGSARDGRARDGGVSGLR